jgi:integrase
MGKISGDGYLSNKVAGPNYYMFLVIDGIKQRKPTGTADADEAYEKLEEWKAKEKAGIADGDKRLRYEDLRDAYIKSGKKLEYGVRRDLNAFFGGCQLFSEKCKEGTCGHKGMFVSAITVRKIQDFKTWRESQEHVRESKAETLEKEIALRTLRASKGRKLNTEQSAKIKADARTWVENGVKATTNKRLTILRAILNHAAKKDVFKGAFTKKDIPASFCLNEGVDNIKQNKFSAEDFENILAKLPGVYHPFVQFLNATGMRSGQAQSITWDMIDENNTLTIPGTLTKSGDPHTISLVNAEGKPYDYSKWIVESPHKPHGEPVFETTDFRSQWRKTCAELKFGVFDEKTRSYRGAQPHDFRRTAVTRMINKGADRADAMAVSGHKTESTFVRYGIQDPKRTQRVFDITGV